MNTPPWPKRFYALDFTRGLAALGVVVWHWQHFFYIKGKFPENFDRSVQPLYPFLKLFYERGGLGVAYFFALSGFVFYWKYGDKIAAKSEPLSRFSWSRFSRLYPLHFVTLLIMATLDFFYGETKGVMLLSQHNDLYHFILHLFFATSWGLEKASTYNGVIWSVSVEVLLYFIFFFFALRRWHGLIPCAALVILGSILSLFDTAWFFIFKGMAMFFLGGMCFHVSKFILKAPPLLASSLQMITLAFWGIVLTHYYLADLLFLFPGKIGEALATQIFPYYLLFPATIVSLVTYETANGPLLVRSAWIGDITYSSYLLHIPMQTSASILAVLGWLNSGYAGRLEFFLGFMTLLIVLSWLVFQYLERPAQKFLRQLRTD